MDGNSLMKWYESYDRLFLHGIDNITDADSIYAAKFMGYYTGVIDATAHLYGFPHRTPLRQLEAITIKYLKAHPEEWNLCGSDLVIKAIKQAYPKKKER